MSWTVEVNSKVLFLPEGSKDLSGCDRYADELFWFVKTGSNNITPFSPNWTFCKEGENYSVVQEVCHQAGFCEGGGLKFGTHPDTANWTTPEEYIANYREKVAAKQTLTITALKSVRHGTIGFGNVKAEIIEKPLAVEGIADLNEFRQKQVLETIAAVKSGYEQEEEFSFSGTQKKTFAFRLKITRAEDFLTWVNYRNILKPLGIWAINN